ncbi:FAD:protein FMN transferase [Marinomonas mediterranea]|jgi:Membrane-associated lipoprotein involved in thiamine biosynthesis|uniref:FAD:protein FMN transferase n=1 Tax=Marinomonas mediterranea (strain ATCC 700492 / JCM 21426 / NBRC 103028 / MMB-1) TaxID=717774 RepID=F2JWQ2_MARM1|nr:FAD:protein FMN transferase [Marinomonas mediterranea]ADZ91816.1 ApbE family lipoprotein [Marinomonas mediterranea MMB-1]WCN17908.1 FAD:protein FMN transferase ApbE [Marinomonas mediterranea MMB-1]
MRNKALLAGLAIVAVAVLYRLFSFTPELVGFSGPTMGTTYTVKFITHKNAPDEAMIKDSVDQVLVKVNKLMSTYDPSSELSLFNRSAAGQSYEASDDIAYVVNAALKISELTDGAYDVTVGPLVNLWGFGPGKHEDRVPTQEEIESAKSKVGYHYLSLDGNQLKKTKDVYVDLSSIAKGYGVDQVALTLEQYGINNYLVEVGGEIRTKGMKLDDAHWEIGVESPAGGHSIAQKVIQADNLSIATSGDYRNYFEKNGVRYSHTIDPKTGKPITHRLVSVTIISDSVMLADGLATAINVLGPVKGLEFAERNDIAAYMLVKEDFGFKEEYSKAFKPYLN